jgi:hypothetical protein
LTFRPPGLQVISSACADAMTQQLLTEVKLQLIALKGGTTATWQSDQAPFTLMLVQAVTSTMFSSSMDEGSQKEYLLRPSGRSGIIAQQGGAVCVINGAAALAKRLTSCSFAVLHYELTQDGTLLPCLASVPAADAPPASQPATAASTPVHAVEALTRCEVHSSMLRNMTGICKSVMDFTGLIMPGRIYCVQFGVWQHSAAMCQLQEGHWRHLPSAVLCPPAVR